MKHSVNLGNIAKALSSLQSEIKDAEKDTQGHGYKYADLYQVLSLIRPLLLKNELSFTQHVGNADDKVIIETMILHSSGEWLSSEIMMPLTPNQRMSAAQSVGTAITYGRRYALTAIFGITQTAEDIDGASDKYEPQKKMNEALKKPDVSKDLDMFVSFFEKDDKAGVYTFWSFKSAEVRTALKSMMTTQQTAWMAKVMKNASEHKKPTPDYSRA